MAFIDNYLTLCKEQGVSPTRVLKDLGISHSMLAAWREGGEPTNRTMKKIADYFNLTVAELNAEEIKRPTAENDDEPISMDEIRFLTSYRKLSPEKRGVIEALMIMLRSGQ